MINWDVISELYPDAFDCWTEFAIGVESEVAVLDFLDSYGLEITMSEKNARLQTKTGPVMISGESRVDMFSRIVEMSFLLLQNNIENES